MRPGVPGFELSTPNRRKICYDIDYARRLSSQPHPERHTSGRCPIQPSTPDSATGMCRVPRKRAQRQRLDFCTGISTECGKSAQLDNGLAEWSVAEIGHPPSTAGRAPPSDICRGRNRGLPGTTSVETRSIARAISCFCWPDNFLCVLACHLRRLDTCVHTFETVDVAQR
jgi:hypothetical protein